MGLWKIWALLVVGLVILGWIRGKHFLSFSTAGFIGLGGLMLLDRASEADQPSNSILLAVLSVAVVLSSLSLSVFSALTTSKATLFLQFGGRENLSAS